MKWWMWLLITVGPFLFGTQLTRMGRLASRWGNRRFGAAWEPFETAIQTAIPKLAKKLWGLVCKGLDEDNGTSGGTDDKAADSSRRTGMSVARKQRDRISARRGRS